MTNATKAQAAIFINSVFAAVVIFGLLSDVKAGALGLVANAALGLYVAITYKDSPKRIPDDYEVEPGPPPSLTPEDVE